MKQQPMPDRRLGIVQLIRDNLEKPRSIRAEANGDTATVWVYDIIGGGFWGGVDPAEFNKELAALDVTQIDLRINSPGGDVFDARAIANALARHPAHVTAYIDGLAASAATTIALAADEIVGAKGTQFMVHNAWAFAFGNRHDMTQLAGLLEKIDGQIAADYVERTGKSAEEVAAWMDAETWFTAEEALDAGFFDRIEGQTDGEKANAWNLSAYRNAPAPAPTPEPEPEEPALDYDRDALERRLSLVERVPA